MSFFKLSNIILIIGLLFSVLILLYFVYRTFNPHVYIYDHATVSISTEYYRVYILISLIFIIFFSFCLKLTDSQKINISLLLSSVVISFYLFEFYLWNFDRLHQFRKNNIPHQIDIINNLRYKDIEAYLNYFPAHLYSESSTIDGLKYKNKIIYPVNGIANISSIFNNENGYYPIIKYDEYGFNNPVGLYDYNKEIDIVIVGDSFAEGVAVNSKYNIQSLFRKAKYETISIGKGSSGPLIQLASIKEYAEYLKPKVVLWFFFENDLNDLQNELKSPTLIKYLNDENYSQELISRQEEINLILKKYMKDMERKLLNKIKKKSANLNQIKNKDKKETLTNLVYFIKLTKLRKRLGLLDYVKLYMLPPSIPHPWMVSENTPLKEFKNILKKSKKLISSWEGKMYLVYIPYKFSYYKNASRHPISQYIFEITSELNIPVIDLHTSVLLKHHKPLLLYEDHFTEEGYKFVAEGLIKELKKENIYPSR